MNVFGIGSLPPPHASRHVFDLRIQTIPAISADQQMPFQWTRFRFGKRPHCVSLQRVIGDVLHENHDSLLRRWQDCLAVPGGGGHQPRFQLRCDMRRFLTLHRGIERFFEELLDPGRRGGDQHPRILFPCVAE